MLFLRYKRKDLKSISNQTIFIDTNILLFNYHPGSGTESASKKWQQEYSGLLAEIILKKIPICTNLFVLSEFYNRYLRFEASIVTKEKSNTDSRAYKEYRDSEIGNATQREIIHILKNRLPGSGIRYIDLSFDHQGILDLFDISGLDFTDRVIVETCKVNDFVLLTDDADFRDSDIPILSLNPNMFLDRPKNPLGEP